MISGKSRYFIWISFLVLPTIIIAGSSGPGINPEQALNKLEEGNSRYVADNCLHPNADASRRSETAIEGQSPFATVIACSDSRVPVEILFDQGIGDIFVIRVAGNVCDVDEVGSIEYGVDHLNTPVCVVLGHTGCGAVTAVCTNAEVHGSIPALVDNIGPAVERARRKYPDLDDKNLVPHAVKYNVYQGIDDLFKSSPAVRDRVRKGTLKVVGAIYDLESGSVKWLGTHPDQSQLLAYTSGPDLDTKHSKH